MTMSLISSTVLGSNGSFDLQNIPQTYQHLQLRIFGAVAASGSGHAGIYLTCNNDGASMSYCPQMYGTGTAATTTHDTLASIAIMPYGYTSVSGFVIIDMFDYVATNKSKAMKSHYGYDAYTAAGRTGFNTLTYAQNTAVNRITITGGGASIASGTRLDLYGIGTAVPTGV